MNFIKSLILTVRNKNLVMWNGVMATIHSKHVCQSDIDQFRLLGNMTENQLTKSVFISQSVSFPPIMFK